MCKNLIFLSFENLNNRLYTNYLMDDFIKKNINIEFITFDKKNITKDNTSLKIKKKSFDNHSIFLEYISKFGSNSILVFLFLPVSKIEKEIYFLLSSKKITKVYFDWGHYPRSIKILNSVIISSAVIDFYRLLRNIFIINKIKIDFLFQSGSKSNLPNFFDSKFKILLNSFDYEYFINKNLKKNIYKKKYAVFIDVQKY